MRAVVHRQHFSTSLGDPTEDGTRSFASELNFHIDASAFDAIDPNFLAFEGQPGLEPGSALVLEIALVQLSDSRGRPSHWYLDTFNSAAHDKFASVQLPEATIKLGRMTTEGVLNTNELSGGSAPLQLRGEPLPDGWLDLKMKWNRAEAPDEVGDGENEEQGASQELDGEEEDEAMNEVVGRATPEDEMDEVEHEMESQEQEELSRKRKAEDEGHVRQIIHTDARVLY